MRRITFDFDNVGGLLDVKAYPSGLFSELKRNYVTGMGIFEPHDDSGAIAIPMYADDIEHIPVEHHRLQSLHLIWSPPLRRTK